MGNVWRRVRRQTSRLPSRRRETDTSGSAAKKLGQKLFPGLRNSTRSDTVEKSRRAFSFNVLRFDWRMMGGKLPNDVWFTSTLGFGTVLLLCCSYLCGWEWGTHTLGIRLRWNASGRPEFESLRSRSVWFGLVFLLSEMCIWHVFGLFVFLRGGGGVSVIPMWLNCSIDLLILPPTRPERSVMVIVVETLHKCHLSSKFSHFSRSKKQQVLIDIDTGINCWVARL